MPIWSLTRERIDKLLKQVGDKELEIDELIKLSKEDLWRKDLDEFINEWRFQLDDEAKRQKKVANMGRRASNKLKIAGGPAGRKRKANNSDDDSDFGGAVAKVKKPAAPKQPGGMLAYLNPDPPKTKKTSPKAKAPSATTKALMESFTRPQKKEKAPDVWMDLDSGAEDPKPAKAKVKTAAPAPTKKALIPKQNIGSEDDDSQDEEIIRPTAGRKPRAAAAKPVKYNTFDSDSDGDDMLLDVGKMVKGIDTASVSANTSRPLFSTSMSRPGSSAGLPKKSSTSSSKIPETIDYDDTNYSMLAPPTTGKGPALTAKKAATNLSNEEEEDEDSYQSIDDIAPAPAPNKASKSQPVPKKSAAVNKPKAPAKAPAAAKKPAKAVTSKPSSELKKPLALSPAAKAYAAKKAKLARETAAAAAVAQADSEEDEIEKVANEIMDEGEGSDDDEEVAVGGGRRPARRAAAASAATKKKWVFSDDDEDDDDDGGEGTTGGFEEDGDSE